MERVWCVCGLRGSNNVALGYDEGSIIIKVSGKKEQFLIIQILNVKNFSLCHYPKLKCILLALSPSAV